MLENYLAPFLPSFLPSICLCFYFYQRYFILIGILVYLSHEYQHHQEPSTSGRRKNALDVQMYTHTYQLQTQLSLTSPNIQSLIKVLLITVLRGFNYSAKFFAKYTYVIIIVKIAITVTVIICTYLFLTGKYRKFYQKEITRTLDFFVVFDLLIYFSQRILLHLFHLVLITFLVML